MSFCFTSPVFKCTIFKNSPTLLCGTKQFPVICPVQTGLHSAQNSSVKDKGGHSAAVIIFEEEGGGCKMSLVLIHGIPADELTYHPPSSERLKGEQADSGKKHFFSAVTLSRDAWM